MNLLWMNLSEWTESNYNSPGSTVGFPRLLFFFNGVNVRCWTQAWLPTFHFYPSSFTGALDAHSRPPSWTSGWTCCRSFSHWHTIFTMHNLFRYFWKLDLFGMQKHSLLKIRTWACERTFGRIRPRSLSVVLWFNNLVPRMRFLRCLFTWKTSSSCFVFQQIWRAVSVGTGRYERRYRLGWCRLR